jgi:hypothetical protein
VVDAARAEPGDGATGSEWRLAPGVWLIEGTAVGAPQTIPGHVYTLVRPDGRRFQVSQSLYHLAELIEQELTLATIAQRLSERLGRPLAPRDVATLIEQKLLPWGAVVPRP